MIERRHPMNFGMNIHQSLVTSDFKVAWLKLEFSNQRELKLRSKTVDAIFVGYSLDSNTYRFFIVNSEIPTISLLNPEMQPVSKIFFLSKLKFLDQPLIIHPL